VIETGVARRFNVRIPLHDGVTLSADLALPESLPAPAVVVRTADGKTGERNSQRAAMFAKAGIIATNRLWHTPSRPSRLILY
jgi:predicted acyl esterase